MATFDYAATRDDADALLTEFGQAVSLRKTVASGTDWEPTQTTADYATVAVILDYTARDIDDENILRTDRRALVAAGPLTALGVSGIAMSDTLVVDGVAIPIVRVISLAPAGLGVMYDCQLRA